MTKMRLMVLGGCLALAFAGCGDGDDGSGDPAGGAAANGSDANGGTGPDANGGTGPDANGGTDPDANGGTDPDANGGTGPDANGGTGPDANGGTDPDANGGIDPDANGGIDPDANGGTDPDANDPDPPRVIGTEDVSGEWCGPIEVQGVATIRAGESLTVCAGVAIRFTEARGVLNVGGTLRIEGRADAPVELSGDAWRGVRVGGVLEARHVNVRGARTCIEGTAGARITVEDAELTCDQGFIVMDDARFDRTAVLGGGVNDIRGGVLSMTDSVIDLGHPLQSPDCTNFNGGGMRLSHVRFTGCHCPLHVNSAGGEVVDVRDSVFDGAEYPVMIARSDAVFRHNNFEGRSAHFLDIGGGIDCDLAENWYEGAAPTIQSGQPGQFRGADAWAMDPYPEAGPRP